MKQRFSLSKLPFALAGKQQMTKIKKKMFENFKPHIFVLDNISSYLKKDRNVGGVKHNLIEFVSRKFTCSVGNDFICIFFYSGMFKCW